VEGSASGPSKDGTGGTKGTEEELVGGVGAVLLVVDFVSDFTAVVVVNIVVGVVVVVVDESCESSCEISLSRSGIVVEGDGGAEVGACTETFILPVTTFPEPLLPPKT